MPASTNVGPSKPVLRPQTKTPVAAAPSAPGAAVSATSPNQAAAAAAANSNSSLRQYLAYTNSNMGREAQSIINGMTSPIIAGYTAQQKAGDQSIVDSTQTYVNELNGIATKAEGAYTTAENQQSALDTAIGSVLHGGDVGAAASRLTAALAAAGQSTAPGAAAQAAASSTDAANYTGASASLSQLFAQGANQTAFDAQQPGLARNAGLQALSTYNAGLTSAEQSAVQSAQDKLPQIMSALNGEARTNLATQTEAFKESQPKIYGSGSSGYFALLPNGKNVQLTAPGAKAPKVFGSASTGYYTIGDNGQTTQLTSPVVKAGSGKAPTTRSINGVTNQWVPGKGWVPLPGGKGGRGSTLTQSQAQSYLNTIVKEPTAAEAARGIPPTFTTNYETAYKHLIQGGMSDAAARTLLDSKFPRGAGGRAWLTNEQQSALQRWNSVKGRAIKGNPVGTPTAVGAKPIIIKDANGKAHAYLTPNQYAVLKANNLAPNVTSGPAPPTGPYAKFGTLYVINP